MTEWKVEKSIINYRGTDEALSKASERARRGYSKIAEWCRQTGAYHIEEQDDYYILVKNEQTEDNQLDVSEEDELKLKAIVATLADEEDYSSIMQPTTFFNVMIKL